MNFRMFELLKFNLKEMGKCTVSNGLHLAGPNQAGLAAHRIGKSGDRPRWRWLVAPDHFWRADDEVSGGQR
jgi:hypothetical protein